MSDSEANETKEVPAQGPLPAGYVKRLVSLLGTGVVSCWWLAHYTEVFPEVASMLALGGIFSWIAVTFKLLPENRVKSLQAGLDRVVLCNPRTKWWAGILAVILFLLANSYGAIRLESALGQAPAAVVVERSPNGGKEERTVASGGSVTLPVRAYWWRPAVLQVKVTGFPERTVFVRPWRRETLSVPQSFQRTVVLLRPTGKLYKDVHNNPMTLSITLSGQPSPLENEFDGTPVWLSSDADLVVPAELRTDWSLSVSPAESAYFVHAWSEPRAFFGQRQEILEGTKITVQLYYPNKEHCYSQPRKITVSDLRKGRSFVQEEVLDACQQ